MAQIQRLPQLIERRWPASRLPPLCQRSRACQCARLPPQYVLIVLQIEDLLLAAVAAFMPRNALAPMPYLDRIGMNSGLYLRARRQRNRIAVGAQLQRQATAWNRKMNRDRVTINWQFTRKKARQKFGYNRNEIIRSET